MSPVKVFITKHSALTYFALTFAISWGLVVVVVGPGGFPGTTGQTEAAAVRHSGHGCRSQHRSHRSDVCSRHPYDAVSLGSDADPRLGSFVAGTGGTRDSRGHRADREGEINASQCRNGEPRPAQLLKEARHRCNRQSREHEHCSVAVDVNAG